MTDTSPASGSPAAPSDALPPPPSRGLMSRTFIGLLVAQFFAAFNDQAVHASAMFFAINTQTLSERDAISLMPILFYAPWALFCTIAGYFADKYSKRNALVTWKVAEVGITAVALLGFWLGTHGNPAGPWVVLSTVFLMGTHSCFFVPAKYGAMPEILPPHLLSKGNGLLESLSFLAVILGTVSGGVLSFLFLRREWVIGLILVGLAVVGAVASLLIRKMPAADPGRRFPAYVYGPLVANVRALVATKALRTALIGIAFFTFVVAFMRAAVYMLGEAQNPRWDELKTSVVVGCVALGIGLGSPLAGWLSGRRVELRLVPVGAAGMIACLLGAAWMVDYVPGLVACIAGIGFFTGFYIVPLFTLLQHKAPKTNKGEMIATSNFVNVTGAILASLLFFAVVAAAQKFGLTPEVAARPTVAVGELTKLERYRGRPVYLEVRQETGDRGQEPAELRAFGEKPPEKARRLGFRRLVKRVLGTDGDPEPGAKSLIEVDKGATVGAAVEVTRYKLGEVEHLDVRPKGAPLDPDYDQRTLPRYLFAGAAALTLLTLLVLVRPLRQVRREGV